MFRAISTKTRTAEKRFAKIRRPDGRASPRRRGEKFSTNAHPGMAHLGRRLPHRGQIFGRFAGNSEFDAPGGMDPTCGSVKPHDHLRPRCPPKSVGTPGGRRSGYFETVRGAEKPASPGYFRAEAAERLFAGPRDSFFFALAVRFGVPVFPPAAGARSLLILESSAWRWA